MVFVKEHFSHECILQQSEKKSNSWVKGATSNEYDGLGRVDQPNSNVFTLVILTVLSCKTTNYFSLRGSDDKLHPYPG